MAKVYAVVADGMEEVECLAVCDVLLRAGVDVKLVSIMGRKEITGSHGFKITADELFEEITDDADVLFLPGGMPGTIHLGECKLLCDEVIRAYESGKKIAAICAAPTVFGKLGLLNGKMACCYPGMEDGLIGAEATTSSVTVDGNIITSRGLGTALDFALTLIEELIDKETADKLAAAVVYM